MRSIGWRERFAMHRKKRKLYKQDALLRSEVMALDRELERVRISELMQKRCDLQDEIDQLVGWLAQGARPLQVAPTGLGKGHSV